MSDETGVTSEVARASLGDRLRALARAIVAEGPYTAGVLREFAEEADRLTEARDLYRADANALLQQKDQWRDSARAAEAQVQRARALADEWEHGDSSRSTYGEAWRDAGHALRAALSDVKPFEQRRLGRWHYIDRFAR